MTEGKLPSGLSPSSIDLYQQCPRRFHVQKIMGGYDPAGWPALLGTFVHRILELLMEKPPEERTVDQARECARLAWPETETHADFELLDLTDEQLLTFKWEGWGHVESYFKMEPPEGVAVVATERFMEVVVDGVPMRGIIDRLENIDDDLIVSDYKTGKVPSPRYRDSKWMQLNFYAAMVEESEGGRPTVGRLIFTGGSEILTTKFTDGSVSEAIDLAKSTWDSVHQNYESGQWEPRPGPLCGWCPVVGSCPEGLAETRLRFLKGRLKKTAPAYDIVAKQGPR